MSALGEMASGIAHEINNPLSIIIMQTTNLLRKCQINELDQAGLEEGLFRITTTTKRVAKVVKGLSAISRNSQNDPIEQVNIANVIQETISLCLEKFKSNSVELIQDISKENELIIIGHSSQIMQVILNLLNNAFDAVLPLQEKWIEIKAYSTDKLVGIKVIDSGHGISDQLLLKIMQPFFTTKNPGKGTGLGLSISKGIIDDHHGQFYYQKNSHNTCFVFELPLFIEK
jgi:C4-dicarboxylate-specific signal transduction histidine kinase